MTVAMVGSERALARKEDWRFSNPRVESGAKSQTASLTPIGEKTAAASMKAAADSAMISQKVEMMDAIQSLKQLHSFDGAMSVQSFEFFAPSEAFGYFESVGTEVLVRKRN